MATHTLCESISNWKVTGTAEDDEQSAKLGFQRFLYSRKIYLCCAPWKHVCHYNGGFVYCLHTYGTGYVLNKVSRCYFGFSSRCMPQAARTLQRQKVGSKRKASWVEEPEEKKAKSAPRYFYDVCTCV